MDSDRNLEPELDADPVIFVLHDVQDVNKKIIFQKKVLGLLLFEGTFTSFFKVIWKLQNSRNQCFSYYFCLMIEGSGFVSLAVYVMWITFHCTRL
jgi:hypothetical protein